MAYSGLRKMFSKLFSNTRWCMSVGMSCNKIILQDIIKYLLEDKLSPDFHHDIFWSEENVILNYFPTLDGV